MIRLLRPATAVVLAVAWIIAVTPGASATTQRADAPGPRLPALEHRPDSVRDTADEVLEQPAYQPPERTPWQRLGEAASLWVRRLLGRLLASLDRGAVAWGVVALTLAVGALLAWRLARQLQPDRSGAPAPVGRVGHVSGDWHADADAHEAAGRWRAAVRCRYRALLAVLAEQGLVDEVPGRTVGEYRRAVTDAAPSMARDFDAASDLFEAVWYAHTRADAELAADLRRHAAALGPTPARRDLVVTAGRHE